MSEQQTLYYVDGSGNYLGGFAGAAPPQGAVAVATPPTDGRQTWNGSAWVDSAASAAAKVQGALTALLLVGITITSTGTPALNGTYATDFQTCALITSEQVYIATTGKFTNGQTTRTWLDASSTPHTFPSTGEFTAFAEAIAAYVDALYLAAQAGGTSWPAASATIA